VVPPDSRQISRARRYLGTLQGGLSPFAYRAITYCGGAFHRLRLGADFVTPRDVLCRLAQVPQHRHDNATGLSRRIGVVGPAWGGVGRPEELQSSHLAEGDGKRRRSR
jgi:hypothetical protein